MLSKTSPVEATASATPYGACAGCGGVARTLVLEEDSLTAPRYGRYCLGCVDQRVGRPPRTLATFAPLFLAGGLIISLLSLASDYFGVSGAAGFGAVQSGALVIGGVLLIIGALWRIDVVATTGAVALVVALLADDLGLAGRAGFGWKQQVGLGMGICLISMAVVLRGLPWFRRRRGLN